MRRGSSPTTPTTPTAFSGISNYLADSYRRDNYTPAVSPLDSRHVFKTHYDELGRYLATYLVKAPTNSRSSARQKLTRLTIQQNYELSTDVYNELIRRKNEKEVPFLPIREEFHPIRNQTRQKLATLSTSRFEDLTSDVYFDLSRRYPELQEDPSGRTPVGSDYDDQPAPDFSAGPPPQKPNISRTSSCAWADRPSDNGYGGSISSQRLSLGRRWPIKIDFSSRPQSEGAFRRPDDSFSHQSEDTVENGGAARLIIERTNVHEDRQERIRRDYEYKITTMQVQIAKLQRELGNAAEDNYGHSSVNSLWQETEVWKDELARLEEAEAKIKAKEMRKVAEEAEEEEAKRMEEAVRRIALMEQSKAEQQHSTEAAHLSFTSLYNWFNGILSDESKYRTLLTFRDSTAQKILDAIQMLLDDPRLSLEHPHFKKSLLMALLRLSKKSALYPKCYTLKGVQRGNEGIAAGHFGEIWKGDFEGHAVCLKVVKVYQKSQVEHLLKAFCKEAIVWKHLSHPNLLQFYGIYHLEDTDNRVCLVSPWMENGNVVEFLQRNPNVARIPLISDILKGISYLHDENIIHGDLKGVNILVTKSGRACVADFGLSSVMDFDILRWTSIETTANTSGTVRWQAQELFSIDDEETMPTKASDIYSFSCTCYEIFTGRVPFHEINRVENVILKVMRGIRPSHPSISMGDFLYDEWGMTDAMWNFMQSCWHADPAMRPTAKQALKRLPVVMDAEDEPKHHNSEPDIMLSFFDFRSANHMPDHIATADVEEIISLVSAF